MISISDITIAVTLVLNALTLLAWRYRIDDPHRGFKQDDSLSDTDNIENARLLSNVIEDVAESGKRHHSASSKRETPQTRRVRTNSENEALTSRIQSLVKRLRMNSCVLAGWNLIFLFLMIFVFD